MQFLNLRLGEETRFRKVDCCSTLLSPASNKLHCRVFVALAIRHLEETALHCTLCTGMTHIKNVPTQAAVLGQGSFL